MYFKEYLRSYEYHGKESIFIIQFAALLFPAVLQSDEVTLAIGLSLPPYIF